MHVSYRPCYVLYSCTRTSTVACEMEWETERDWGYARSLAQLARTPLGHAMPLFLQTLFCGQSDLISTILHCTVLYCTATMWCFCCPPHCSARSSFSSISLFFGGSVREGGIGNNGEAIWWVRYAPLMSLASQDGPHTCHTTTPNRLTY